MSLTQIHVLPPSALVLLVGPPGSGKSTFCYQVVLNTIEDKPIIYVTTESAPSKVVDSLEKKGLGKVLPHPISFVDAFHKTMGLSESAQFSTEEASSESLVSLSIAIMKLRKRIRKEFLLVFDSLTSPYLMNGIEIFRFLKKTLSKLAAEGNSILVSMDEGCGKNEDLVAMMSIADGILKIELENDIKTYNVIKYPEVKPIKIQIPLTFKPTLDYQFDMKLHMHHTLTSMGLKGGRRLRTEVGDSVHMFWPNFARWSGMFWDPKRFPTMTYNSNKNIELIVKQSRKLFPLRAKLFFRFLLPKDFSKVKDMKKLLKYFRRLFEGDRGAITEYDEKASKTDEHYLKLYESGTCWGFDNVGANLHLGVLGAYAGALKGFENRDRDWNIIETKCIGLGHEYCELKIVPGEINELKNSLESIDNAMLEKIHERLMDRLMGYMLHGKPLWKKRPRLGNETGLHTFSYKIQSPAMSSERYRIAMRFGGVLAGKKVGEKLMENGISEEKSILMLKKLLEYCKVGKVSIGKTIRIIESCESITIEADEPYCFFTTGFLNGFFSTIKNQYIKEKKCIATGDPYCEWELK